MDSSPLWIRLTRASGACGFARCCHSERSEEPPKLFATTFSGVISGSGGLGKVGTGSFALDGDNTYTGSTSVESGTVGGSGSIGGKFIVGTGSGSGATLAPAAGRNRTATLTIHKSLRFQSDGIYAFALQATKQKAASDEVIAKGVTIANGAQFKLVARGKNKLPPGASFTVISNTASTPISGAFANLPDGATISAGNTKLQADYEGGDGNDLTLTVVP